jgi:DNA-binding LacI/PurR family transcriptional regulator
MRVTLRDVARRLNLSDATVSRVLNGRDDPFISEATRRRVKAVAGEMGYRPNRTARALVTGRTHLISLWMLDLYSPFYAQVVYHVAAQLRPLPYQMLVTLTDRDPRSPSEMRDLASWEVDGILAHENAPFLNAFREANPSFRPPIVAMGSFSCPPEEIDRVGIDLYSGTVEAVRHLVARGGRRIAYLVNDRSNFPDKHRHAAYHAVLGAAGLPPESIVTSDQSRGGARVTVRDYVRDHGCPDALFCHNDDMAIGAYLGLRDQGIRIPDDVALVGCDGIEDTEWLECPLSTLAQPLEQMCALAGEFLQRRIDDPNAPRQQAMLQPTLVIRESSRETADREPVPPVLREEAAVGDRR